jgi:type IV secretory pathway VirB2 component (pilin)
MTADSAVDKMGTAHFEPPQAVPTGEAPGTARVTRSTRRLPETSPAQPSGPVPATDKPASRPNALTQLLAGHTRKAHILLLLFLPALAFAQASPFQTGATALQTSLLTLLTPVAVILVIGLGVMAMANRIAWGWCIGAIAGIAIAFGAPQIVGWIRGMFGV